MKSLSFRQIWFLELLWWIFTAVLLVVILYPIYESVPDYPFWMINCIAIIAFVTFARHIFFLRFSTIAYAQTLKIVLAIACIPLVFMLVNQFNIFQTYLDENGILPILGHLPPAKIDSIDRYMRSEMALFSVGAIISGSILAVRLIISVWKLRNRGTV